MVKLNWKITLTKKHQKNENQIKKNIKQQKHMVTYIPAAFWLKKLKSQHENNKTTHDFDNYPKTYMKVQKYPQMQTLFFILFKIKYVF
jgi:2-C-methyl-D-erythritol 4-phosphate cytidylyltransferase